MYIYVYTYIYVYIYVYTYIYICMVTAASLQKKATPTRSPFVSTDMAQEPSLAFTHPVA